MQGPGHWVASTLSSSVVSIIVALSRSSWPWRCGDPSMSLDPCMCWPLHCRCSYPCPQHVLTTVTSPPARSPPTVPKSRLLCTFFITTSCSKCEALFAAQGGENTSRRVG